MDELWIVTADRGTRSETHEYGLWDAASAWPKTTENGVDVRSHSVEQEGAEVRIVRLLLENERNFEAIEGWVMSQLAREAGCVWFAAHGNTFDRLTAQSSLLAAKKFTHDPDKEFYRLLKALIKAPTLENLKEAEVAIETPAPFSSQIGDIRHYLDNLLGALIRLIGCREDADPLESQPIINEAQNIFGEPKEDEIFSGRLHQAQNLLHGGEFEDKRFSDGFTAIVDKALKEKSFKQIIKAEPDFQTRIKTLEEEVRRLFPSDVEPPDHHTEFWEAYDALDALRSCRTKDDFLTSIVSSQAIEYWFKALDQTLKQLKCQLFELEELARDLRLAQWHERTGQLTPTER